MTISPDVAASLATPYRTHTAGELRASDVGATARLSGWVHRRRDHGHLIFLDVRDRHGITQVVVDQQEASDAHAVASRARSEFVITVEGEVAARLPGTENPRLATGAVELRARAFEILSESKTPPFYINEPDAPIDEPLRLKYRYLDIRREAMAQRLLLRSRLVQAIREVHHANGFVEVETPNLIKSTPEGARDFVVPSRLQPGTVYALPQSPQQLKQILMVAGIDRYFQIARCFRDEDLRGDRQPEFTQLDLEMSFVDEDAVMAFVERMVIEVSRATVPDRPLQETPFPRFTFDEAMERFGSDKPDLRFGMELVDLAPALQGGTGFSVFDDAVIGGKRVKAIVAPGMADATRKQIDELIETAKRLGAKGLVHFAVAADGVHSPVAKFLAEGVVERIVEATGADDRRPDPRRRRRARADRRRSGPLARGTGQPPGPGRSHRARVLLGPPLPDVPVGRRGRALGRHAQPVQRRRPGGRGAAHDRLGRPVAARSPTTPPAAPARCSTTSRSTAGSSAAARSGSGEKRCSSAASGSRVTRSSRCTSGSAPCSRRSTTARRRTAESRSASIAGLRCSATRPTSARSWPSRRPSQGAT